jgi:hypothetical protein
MPSDVGGRDQDQPVQRGDVLVRPSAAIERERKRQEEAWKLSKEDGGGESVGAREGEDSAPSGSD